MWGYDGDQSGKEKACMWGGEMIFKPSGFRHYTPDQYEPKIRESTLKTLILVTAEGSATYAVDRSSKDAIIAQWKPDDDMLLMAWTGKWRTDIFLMTKAEIDTFYR